MNKVSRIIIALALLAFIVGGFFLYRIRQQTNEMKDVLIEIVLTEERVSFTVDTVTQDSTLEELLLSLEETGEILLELKEFQNGKYIVGLGTSKLIKENPQEGTAWTYTSATNSQCIEANYCPGISDLLLEEDDHFVFTLTDY